jgi:hypothetical protein
LLLVTVVVFVAFSGVAFFHEATTAAKNAVGPQRTRDVMFAAVGNGLIEQTNAFDAHLTYLLEVGALLTRADFAARLDQLALELPNLASQVDLLEQPSVAHGVNTQLMAILNHRLQLWRDLIGTLRLDLALPLEGTAPIRHSTQALSSELRATQQSWNHVRHELRHSPGHVTLRALRNRSGEFLAQQGIAELTGSSMLHLVRGIGIAAISLRPNPLPQTSSWLTVPTTNDIYIGVSVSNAAYDTQPVTLRVTLTPLNGRGRVHTFEQSVVLGPDRSFAFSPPPLGVKSNEEARLIVQVTGAPAGGDLQTVRRYFLKTLPSLG